MILTTLITLGLSLVLHGDGRGQSDSLRVEDEPLVFYLNGTKVLRVDKSRLAGQRPKPLPDQLIITSGTYSFAGGSYRLQKEGLYRFLLPGRTNLQRIVYETDIDSFLSAISWIHSHGNSDAQRSEEELTEKALHSKLLITCSEVSRWGKYLLASRGIKSRLVGGVTLEKWNSYDDGHDLIEVWRSKWQKWVLYDLDNSNYFIHRQNARPMSLVEFVKAVPDNHYEIIHISSPAPLDAGNFKSREGYDYAFYIEAILSNIRKWYMRVMQVPLIYDDAEKKFFFYDVRFSQRVRLHDPNDKFIPENEFMKKFYSGVGVTSKMTSLL